MSVVTQLSDELKCDYIMWLLCYAITGLRFIDDYVINSIILIMTKYNKWYKYSV